MDTRLKRPFYFIVVLWGERFRTYFLEYCLPSLLSPGNIPALATSQASKFLIATRPDDWRAMEATPIFDVLKRYLTPVFVEIPPCPPDKSGCQHMGIGHKLACEIACRDDAYGVVLTPDSMLSDGSVSRLQELACDGVKLVLAAALRFGEEPFLGHLRELGAVTCERRSESGRSLTITGRQMVYAAVNGFHSQTLAYEWDDLSYSLVIPAAWWRVPGEEGVLVHSLSWAPVLLDYGAIVDHDTSTLDEWTLDGDYLYKNLSHIDRIYVVQDSDDLFLASWAPLADQPIEKTKLPLFGHRLAKAQFGSSFHSSYFDPLKRCAFFHPVRWHSRPLNYKWTSIEKKAAREIGRYIRLYGEYGTSAKWRFLYSTRRLSDWMFACLLGLSRVGIFAWVQRNNVWRHLANVPAGDFTAFHRIFFYVQLFMFNKIPRAEETPRPPVGLDASDINRRIDQKTLLWHG
jgi:hypothetical protein